MKKSIGLALLGISITIGSCSPTNEIVYSNPDKSFSMFNRTENRVLIGHGGLFYRTIDKYDINFSTTTEAKYDYTDIQVNKENKTLELTGGFVEFKPDNQVVIELFTNGNGKSKKLPINGKYRMKE
jgi:hypothetical protein